MKRLACVAAVAAALTLTACSGPASPPVETIKPATTPTATQTPEAERGTRENPLAIGEQRKITDDSMWSVGAAAPSTTGAGYVALPIHIGLDWEAAKAQGMPDGEGVDPSVSLWIEYVSASGRSFSTDEVGIIDIPNPLYQVGTVYPPLAEVSANYVVTLPDAEIEGGVWKVANSNDDAVFIAAR